MARDSFLLRTDPQTLQALRRWAEEELRSVNGQIEYLLRKALREAGRLEKLGPDLTGNDEATAIAQPDALPAAAPPPPSANISDPRPDSACSSPSDEIDPGVRRSH